MKYVVVFDDALRFLAHISYSRKLAIVCGGLAMRIQFIVILKPLDWCRKSLSLSSIADCLRSPTVDVDLVHSDGKS